MRVALITTDNREFHDSENPVPHFGTAPAALIQGFAEHAEAEVHVISCTRRKLPAPQKLAENIFFHSLHVPKIGWLRTAYQGCIRAVRQRVRQVQPDIVHGQGTERDCAISAVFSGFPNVLTIHGNMRAIARMMQARPLSYYWLMARLERFTLPRTQGVIAITRYTQDEVRDIAKKTWLVPNAVEETFLQIERSVTAIPSVLCVGNVDLRKNQNAFIRSLDSLANRAKFRLIFLGSADPAESYAKEFLQLVAEREWCQYDGFADRTKLRRYFAEAALLVLPSLEDNCPMSVLEAMAAGVPVVAALVGGVPDLVADGRTGLLIDPKDPKSMEFAVARILEDNELARRLATEAKTEACVRFRPKIIAGRHLEIYAEVLSKPA